MESSVFLRWPSPRGATALFATGSLLTLGTGAGVVGATLLAGPASAAAFAVTNLNDDGDGSLRKAILDANATFGIDSIAFDPNLSGTLTLFSDLPQINEGASITGPGSAAVTISGADAFHIFDVQTVGTGAVTISGLTLSDSVALAGISGDGQGGAIRVLNSPITLNDLHVSNSVSESNVDNAFGGGLFIDNESWAGDVTITNSVVTNNTAESTALNYASEGGGAWISARNVTIESSSFSLNSADVGGGILVTAQRQLTIDNSVIAGNWADVTVGGLIAGGFNVVLTDSVITGNYSVGMIGGIYLGAFEREDDVPSAISVSNTRISDNIATEFGGGVLFNFGSAAQLDRVTVTENDGGRHGGLDVIGDLNMTSSTIADNTGIGMNLGSADGPTSVSVCSASSSSRLSPSTSISPFSHSLRPMASAPTDGFVATISNTTITGNSDEGITINEPYLGVTSPSSSPSSCGYEGPTVELGLVHVLAADNGLEDVAAPALSLFSLIERPNAGVYAGYGTITGVDPELQPLQSINATTSVVPIGMNSPAWNAGWPNFTPPPATDQRGLPRVVDIIDIGAYEVQEAVLLPKFTG